MREADRKRVIERKREKNMREEESEIKASIQHRLGIKRLRYHKLRKKHEKIEKVKPTLNTTIPNRTRQDTDYSKTRKINQ